MNGERDGRKPCSEILETEERGPIDIRKMNVVGHQIALEVFLADFAPLRLTLRVWPRY